MILSLSINTVFCIIATTLSWSSLFVKNFSQIDLQLLNTTTQCSDYDGDHVDLITWASSSCFESEFSVLSHLLCFLCSNVMLLGARHATYQVFLSLFNSKIRSGPRDAVLFRIWNLKYHKSFAILLSNTVPLPHRC